MVQVADIFLEKFKKKKKQTIFYWLVPEVKVNYYLKNISFQSSNRATPTNFNCAIRSATTQA